MSSSSFCTGAGRIERVRELPRQILAKMETMDVAIGSPKLWTLAMQVFGSEQKADLWLHTSLSELQDHTPAAVLEQTPDSPEVEAILERIEYGVFS